MINIIPVSDYEMKTAVMKWLKDQSEFYDVGIPALIRKWNILWD